MSIYPVKLSTWIDKEDPNCNYKRFVKMVQHWTCKNPKCSHKCGYGAWDMHSAPYGYGDGPFCSKKCLFSGNLPSRNGKYTKKKIEKERVNWQKRMEAFKIKLNMEKLNE